MKISLNCFKCGKLNSSPRSNFCSQNCRNRGYLKKCNECNEDFRGASSAKYCSRKCYHLSDEFKKMIKRHNNLQKKEPLNKRLCKYCDIIKDYTDFREVNKNLHKGIKKEVDGMLWMDQKDTLTAKNVNAKDKKIKEMKDQLKDYGL